MEREFDPLPIRELGAGAGFRRPTQVEAARVTPDSPALHVMTDLASVSPATIRPQAPLAGANQFMITRGVRLLLVVDERDVILGLITATDLLGERPMQVATERGLRRDELSVGDVRDARGADRGDRARRRGSLPRRACPRDAAAPRPAACPRRDAGNTVRGIFSISQIARQLGVTLASGGSVARTFRK